MSVGGATRLLALSGRKRQIAVPGGHGTGIDRPEPPTSREPRYDRVDEEGTPLFALMFYSPLVADQLRHRRKTVTIRLGDKSGKYKKGMVIPVLVGQRFGPRDHVFDAVIDKVEVKALMELSPREIQHDNPEVRQIDEFVDFMRRLYNRDVDESSLVTVISFSEIRKSG